MTNPYPIPRSVRQTDILLGNGGSVYGPFDGWRIFDLEDVEVWVKPANAVIFTKAAVTVSKVSNLPYDLFTVAFAAAIPSTSKYVVRSSRIAERSAGVDNGTRINMAALEKELSKVTTTLQELRRDIGRALLSDFDQVALSISSPLEDGQTLMRSGNALVGGPNLQTIADEAIQALVALIGSMAPIQERTFELGLGSDFVEIPGGFDIIAYVFLEGLRLRQWSVDGGRYVRFPAITAEDLAGQEKVEMTIGAGNHVIAAFDMIDGGRI